MSRGIYVALSGALAQQNALDATATNIANASSPGFQKLRPIFKQELASAARRDPSLHYTSVSETALDTSSGAARVTERALDAVLPAGTYLGVEAPKGGGERYTRAVSLVVSPDGSVRTQSGANVVDESGKPIKADAARGEVRLAPNGSVNQGGAPIGKLRIVRFEKPEALSPEGGGLLAAGGAGAVTPVTDPIQVGAVEESNAQPVVAMTEMMTANRTFEAFQKVLETMGEADRKLLTTVPGALE